MSGLGPPEFEIEADLKFYANITEEGKVALSIELTNFGSVLLGEIAERYKVVFTPIEEDEDGRL